MTDDAHTATSPEELSPSSSADPPPAVASRDSEATRSLPPPCRGQPAKARRTALPYPSRTACQGSTNSLAISLEDSLPRLDEQPRHIPRGQPAKARRTALPYPARPLASP
eukprot:Selendium_serpulae@DN6236_c4_g1_i2.p3